MTTPPSNGEAAPARQTPTPEAIEQWRNRIRTDTFAQYHHKMGFALAESGEANAAAAAFGRALDTDPDSFGSLYRLVQIHRAAGREDLAESLLGPARRRHPDPEALGMALAARDLLDVDRTAGAEAMLRDALARCGDVARGAVDVLVAVGAACRGEKRVHEAVAWLGRAAPHASGDPVFLHEYGSALLAAGRLREAIAALDACVRLDPTWITPYFDLGTALRFALRFDEAAACFGRVHAAGHRLAQYAETLGAQCQLLAGRAAEARTALDRIVTATPAWPLGVAYRSLCHLRLGDAGAAQAEAMAAVRSQGMIYDAWIALGAARLALKRYGEAAHAFGRAVAIVPHYASGHVGLACAASLQGHGERASALIGKAVLVEPHGVPLACRVLGDAAAAVEPILQRIGFAEPW